MGKKVMLVEEGGDNLFVASLWNALRNEGKRKKTDVKIVAKAARAERIAVSGDTIVFTTSLHGIQELAERIATQRLDIKVVVVTASIPQARDLKVEWVDKCETMPEEILNIVFR